MLIIILFGFIIQPISSVSFKIYFVQPYKYPSISLTPTILKGDKILVSKLSYNNAEPEKGDMIVFPLPEDPSKLYTKRIIGTGDDKIEIKNDKLYINDEEVLLEKLGEYSDENVRSSEEYLEKIGEKSYHIIYTVYRSENLGPILVPKNSLFVLGDNRDNSEDSRFWGFVEKDTVIGKVVKIYWSWDNITKRIRWERIGKHIE